MQAQAPIQIVRDSSRELRIYDFEGIAPLLHRADNDTTYILNFWATWCKPCVAELPYFEQLHRDLAKEKVKVILVSLDFKREAVATVLPFLKRNNITAQVVLLSDPDANAWINRIDSTWTGSLPATLMYRAQKRAFYEETFTYEKLLKAYQTMIQ